MPRKAKHGEQPCPECKEPVAFDATRCPHCQVVYEPATVERRKRAHAEEKKLGMIGCGGLALLLVLAVAFCGSESIPDEPGETAIADAKAFHDAVIAQTVACDAASERVANTLQTGDVFNGYRAAREAEAACLKVRIRDIEIPASVGKAVHAKLAEARQICDDAYVAKWSAMNSTVELLGDGGGVAALADATDSMERSGAGVVTCVTLLMTALTDLGVKLEDLPQVLGQSEGA